MRFAYLSLDEVNQYWAQVFAQQFEVDLQSFTRIDELMASPADAMIFDLDSLPAVERQRFFRAWQERRLAQPLAVHSYNLTERQERALKRRGIRVWRRMDAQMLVGLAQHVRRQAVSC